jgi:2-polyprenyl-3-methyl-5-hydroxy-6-metoxy-1,4-benzoquinol methylase
LARGGDKRPPIKEARSVADVETQSEKQTPAVVRDAEETPDPAALVGALFEAREQLRLAHEREDALVARMLGAEHRAWQAIAAHRMIQSEINRIERSRFFRWASRLWDLQKKLGLKRPATPEDAPEPLPDVEAISAIVEAELPPGPAADIAKHFSHLRHEKNGRYFRALAVHLRGLRDDPRLETVFQFAISCNERGEKVARMLARHVPLAGKRYLDIGCAYGGFLIAFAHHGAEVTGIDLDPLLLELARANFEDHGMSARLIEGDATRPEDVRDLGVFDLITANDVLEHVEDPRATIRHVGDLLAPGGVFYIEVPNPDFPEYVLSDGHYHLFAITLLDHEDAIRYYALHAPGVPYGVGASLRLGEMLGLIEEAGLVPELLASEQPMRPIRRALEVAGEVRKDLPRLLAPVPGPIRPRVAEKATAWAAELEAAPRRGWEAHTRFLLRYGTPFWRILVRKPAPSA